MHIEPLTSPNALPGRHGERPRAVVVHTTEQTAESATGWFLSPTSEVSAHYLVGLDGHVRRFVAEEDTARHTGILKDPDADALAMVGDDPNATTIGIEFADDGRPGEVTRPDAQYEAGGKLLAGISARWGIPVDEAHVIPHRALRADKLCPGNLDIPRLVAEARRPLVAALLPVRNEAARLREWLERARAFADVVIALDDGSTDEGADILEADALVHAVLRNPPRDSYAGWDDATNRRRLLEAAAELRPRWVVQLDADEFIDADDSAALRGFLSEGAVEGCAYGLRHHRAWAELVDDREVWVYRVFAWRPGLRLPDHRRLHFNPVPVDIPRKAWIRTTIRFRHVGASDGDAITARDRKYDEADPPREFEANTGGMEAPPDTEHLVEWKPRETATPVLVDPVEQAVAGRGRRDLVVLLPVRNGAAELPGWLESVRGLADAVIALDDGSTDATSSLLESDPLVSRVLANPARDGWAGWDEVADRQRLLDAVADLRPRFVMFLDVDERIPADDAQALRAFVEEGAKPGVAYGFLVHRLVREDPPGFDQAGLWVYRLFAWAPDQRLPTDRALHFPPVPTTIARGEKTSVRIVHRAALTAEHRRERYEKYAELDPAREHQAGYGHLLSAPGTVRDVEPRTEGLPVVRSDEIDLDAPVLSAVVIARDDSDRIERVLTSVVGQETSEPFEVIVVVSGSSATARLVAERFPQLTLVELDAPALPGAARNAGLAVARGDFVSFPGSHVELAPGSLQARMEAHERGYPMVTGSILNGTDTPAGWANYFMDHSTALPGRLAGELSSAPAHCSYDRGFLEMLGGFPPGLRAGEDTWVNTRLFALGKKAWREPSIVLAHVTRCDTLPKLLAHHFRRGRGLGRLWFDPALRPGTASIRPMDLLAVVPRRLRGIDRALRMWGSPDERRRYVEVRHLIVAATATAWLGTLLEGARFALEALRERRGPPTWR